MDGVVRVPAIYPGQQRPRARDYGVMDTQGGDLHWGSISSGMLTATSSHIVPENTCCHLKTPHPKFNLLWMILKGF